MKKSNVYNKKMLEIAEVAMGKIQPIAEEAGSNFMDLAKEVTMSKITNLFTKGKEKIKNKMEGNNNVKTE